MNEQELPPLSSELKELLANAPRPSPPPGFDAAVLTKVKATLAAGGAAAAAGAVAGAKLGAWGAALSVGALVVGVATGLGAGAVMWKDKAVEQRAALAPMVETPTPPVEEPVVVDPPIDQTPARKPLVKKTEDAPKRDLQLAEERGLIEIARTALVKRDTERALTTLEDHARKFPAGQLVEERESLMVQALVNAGQVQEARERAAAFRKRFPDSMLLPAVEAALKAAE